MNTQRITSHSAWKTCNLRCKAYKEQDARREWSACLIGCVASKRQSMSHKTDFILHNNHESENRFWSLLAGIFACAIVFGETPFSFGTSYPLLGVVSVILSTAYVFGYRRDVTRSRLKRSNKLIKSHPHISGLDTRSAQGKLKSIECDLNVVDVPSVTMKWFPSRHRAIMKAEERIIETFRLASRDELNFIVSRTQLALLFYKIKDYDVLRRTSNQHRTRFLELLTIDRVNDLGLRSKVAILDALQKMRLHAHPRGEEFVLSVIRSTKGHALTKLKSYMDSKGTFHNLHKLVFTDVRSDKVRDAILAHIYDEGAFVRRKSLRIRLRKRRLRKVLSDVDDTLFSSGGRYPAGTDRTYPRHALYPGVLAFYEELDKQDSAPTVRFAHDQMAVPSNLTFLSARPHVYKDTSESVTYRKFAWLRKHRDLYTEPTLLAGGLPSGIKMFTGDFGPLASKKVLNWTQYAALYPEFEFIFVGDNGQGDVLTAEAMLQSNIGDRVEAVFIHLVKPLDLTPGARPGGSASSPVSSPSLRAISPSLDPMLSAESEKERDGFSLQDSSSARVHRDSKSLSSLSTETTAGGTQDVNTSLNVAGREFTTTFQSIAAHSAISVRASPANGGSEDNNNTNDDEEELRSLTDAIRVNVSPLTSNKRVAKDKARDVVITPTPDAIAEGSGRWKRMGIVFFQTYVGAAQKAAEMKKMTFDGALRVARCAIRDFFVLDTEACWARGIAGAQREAARLELNRDIAEFNRFAADHPEFPAFTPLPYISCAFAPEFPPGDSVKTPWGLANVIRRRECDAMYEVELTRWRLAGGVGVRVFCPSVTLHRPRPCEVGDRVRCKYGGIGIVTKYRYRDGMYRIQIDRERKVYVHYSTIESRVPAALGDVVHVSKYGVGVVTGWRRRDNMFEVELFWGGPHSQASKARRISGADSLGGRSGAANVDRRVLAFVPPRALKLVPKKLIPREITKAPQLNRKSSPVLRGMSSLSGALSEALCSWGSRD
eukprot:g3607.t1